MIDAAPAANVEMPNITARATEVSILDCADERARPLAWNTCSLGSTNTLKLDF